MASTDTELKFNGERMFNTVTLASWADIHKYAEDDDWFSKGWLFRGQGSAKWPLRTSLERCCDRLAVRAEQRPTIEDRIIREFRRAYHQFARHLPDRQAILEWLSIMQHHGAPTRLLDFTYSIYVATYFAVEDAEGASSVWAINGPWALQRSKALLHSAGKRGTQRMLKPLMDDDEKVARALFMSKPYVAAAWPINPFRLNERLRVQQGAFLIQNDISKPFTENLTALSRGRRTDRILKIVIPAGLRREVLRRLWSMDISRASLFPGLDGFAKSLGINHSLFHPAPWSQPSARKRR